MGNLRGRRSLLVDVDMANIVDGSTGLFMYIETWTLPLGRWCYACNRRDFRPSDLALTFHLPAGARSRILARFCGSRFG